MDAPPSICVVIPHLNQPEMLEECLAALERQTYPSRYRETIVVDNGSTEEPTDVVEAFDGVRLDREPTPGPGPARNRGAALTSMDILAFVDADCIAHPLWLEAIASRFARCSGPIILGGDVQIAFDDPTRLSALEAYEAVFAYRQRDYIEKQGFSGTGNLAVRRRDFEAIGAFGGIDEAEDRAWGRRAVSCGYRFEYLPDMVVYHPARRSFEEIATKWSRHIRHDYADWVRAGKGNGSWLLRAGAVAGSGLVDVRRIVASQRIGGIATRMRAAAILARVRAYRAWRMMTFIRKPEQAKEFLSWNRPARQR